jgi:hypothetical protein
MKSVRIFSVYYVMHVTVITRISEMGFKRKKLARFCERRKAGVRVKTLIREIKAFYSGDERQISKVQHKAQRV